MRRQAPAPPESSRISPWGAKRFGPRRRETSTSAVGWCSLRYNLIRDGGTVRHLEPQVMDLLVFLATASG